MSRIKKIGYICAAIGVICALVGMAVVKGPVPAAETKTFSPSETAAVFCDTEYELLIEGTEIKIEFEHAFDGEYRAELNNGVLAVVCRPDLPWYRKLFAFIFGDGVKLKITLPEGQEGRIPIMSTDGRVRD